MLLAGCIQGGGSTATPTPAIVATPTPAIVATPTPVAEVKTYKVGAVLALTGTLANIGEGMKNAMQLAEDEANAKEGCKVELVIEDTACEAAKGVTAAQKLANVDKVVGVAGPTCSGESLSAMPVLTQAGIVVLSPSATSPKLTIEGGEFFFRLSPSDAFQGKLAAQYARNKLETSKAAILYLNNDWGVGLRDAFETEFTTLEGTIVAKESFEEKATDVKTQLTKIKAKSPTLVYSPCFPAECAIILKQATELGITARFMGADGSEDAKTLAENVGDAANGFTLTVPASASSPDFAARYKARFNADP